MPSPLIFIIIIVFLLGLWIAICYGITYLIAFGISELIPSKFKIDKKIILLVSVSIAGLSTLYLLFSNPATNYKNAYLEDTKNSYKVTIKGKRVLNPDFPGISIPKRAYEDSFSFLIPRKNGRINGDEIQIAQNGRKPTGTITMEDKKMTIEFYYDSNRTMYSSWNGNYNINFR